LIILAAPTRPLEDVILEQLIYVDSLLTSAGQPGGIGFDTVQQQISLVKSDALKASMSASNLLLGLPATYWLDLREYRPSLVARELSIPMLILHGERDYQATMTDFVIWREALSDRADVTCKSYPKLNHLFMAGEGKATPTEYMTGRNHVDPEVIRDIAEWIVSH